LFWSATQSLYPRSNACPSAEKSPESDREVPIVIGLPLALPDELAALLAEVVAPPPPLLLLAELLPFEELPQAATTMTAPSASPDVRHLRRILIPSPSALECRPDQGRAYRVLQSFAKST
jgi:hypothetical protein